MTKAQEDEAFQEMHEYEKEIKDHNERILSSLGDSATINFIELLESTSCSGKIEFVDEPAGDDQGEDPIGIFSNIHVNQWSTGISGDSYAGFIYAQIPDGRWVQVPYEC